MRRRSNTCPLTCKSCRDSRSRDWGEVYFFLQKKGWVAPILEHPRTTVTFQESMHATFSTMHLQDSSNLQTTQETTILQIEVLVNIFLRKRRSFLSPFARTQYRENSEWYSWIGGRKFSNPKSTSKIMFLERSSSFSFRVARNFCLISLVCSRVRNSCCPNQERISSYPPEFNEESMHCTG